MRRAAELAGVPVRGRLGVRQRRVGARLPQGRLLLPRLRTGMSKTFFWHLEVQGDLSACGRLLG